MGFLQEIQQALVAEDCDLAAVLMKVRLLAAKLGSHPLEEWVKYESEGYPDDAELPEYRRLPVSYVGDFENLARRYTNAAIPSYAITKHAGEHWNTHELRESMAGIAELEQSAKNGSLYLQAANLGLLLQGHVYPGMACHGVRGSISAAGLTGIRSSVKNRVLELTIELEKAVPEAASIGFGQAPKVNEAAVTQVINQVFHGAATSVLNTGAGANVNVSVQAGDLKAFAEALITAGIAKQDAEEFSKIVASEKPESKTEPFGAKAKAWIADNLKKAVDGTWKVGVGVATGVLTKAALQYYGLDS